MRILHYIPGFLSLIGALIVIIASLCQQVPFSDLGIYTSIVLIVFYIIGLFVRKVYSNAYEESKEKERRKEIEIE